MNMGMGGMEQNQDPRHHFHTVSKAFAENMRNHWDSKVKIHDHMAKMLEGARVTAIKKRIAERFKPKTGG
jgi:hypothetical protein